MIDVVMRTKIQLDGITRFLSNYSTIAETVAHRVYTEEVEPIINELKRPPRVRNYPEDYPLEWTSERQRRAYFATNGFGVGIPYRRTGKLTQSWVTKIMVTQNQVEIVIYNKSPIAKYVYGLIGTKPSKTNNPQQRFHVITGWHNVKTNPLPTAIKRFIKVFSQQYRKEVNDAKPQRRKSVK